LKECRQIPTAERRTLFAERTTSHENKNLTNKQNSVEKTFWLIQGNNNKPLNSVEKCQLFERISRFCDFLSGVG
jgi:hypothetical protein